MQFPTEKQWWSYLKTQLSHSLQWDDLKGLTILHVGHIFAIFKTPLWTVFEGIWLILYKLVFLFIIPGSVNPVIQNNAIWYIVKLIRIDIV